MVERISCSRCGVVLTGQALGELCANCLLKLALESPVEPTAISNELEPAPAQPTRVRYFGDYELVEEIARGGMGVVYKARQVSLNRIVALKMILAGDFSSPAMVERFRTEAEAAARLEHPNIVPIHEIGTHEGQHYFSMRFVEGGTLTRAMAGKKFTARRAAELMVKVARAVHHAHQHGILHRDLKPGNILLDRAGEPHVADFGLAKLLEHDSALTQSATVMGTPSYMAPEQAEGQTKQATTAVDIYSLGAILYELLTGRPPFVGSNSLEVLVQVREREPASPQSLNPELDRDLAVICLKCLEKDSARRYGSAEALAEDLQRWLSDEPIQARRTTPPERAWKWARRKPVVASLIATVFFVVTVGLVGILWQGNRAKEEAVRATNAERVATDRLIQISAESDAKEAARRDAEAILTFLGEVFQSPDPARDGRTITVAETLDTAAMRLETDLAKQPQHRARLWATIGGTYHALGLYREAILLREQVRNYHLATSGQEHPETLMAMHHLASSYDSAGRLVEALKLREEVLTLRRKVLGPANSDTIRAMHNLALSYYDNRQRDEALKLREEALRLFRKVLGPEHSDTLSAMQSLAISFYYGAGRPGDALKLQEEVLMLRRKLNGPEHPHTLLAMINLALSYSAAGRRDEALELQQEALDLRRKVLGPEHPDTIKAMDNLARFSYAAAGRRDEALKLQEEALTLRRRLNGPEHPDTLLAMHNLASSYYDARRRDEALQLREEVLALRRKVLGPEHSDTIREMQLLAYSYADAGRQDEALSLHEGRLVALRKSATRNPSDLEAGLVEVAELHYRQGNFARAELLYREKLQSRRHRPGWEESDSFIGSTASLGRLLCDWAWAERATNAPAAFERAREGEALLREALTARSRQTNASPWRMADVQSRIGGALCALAFSDLALTSATRELRLSEAEKLLQESQAALEPDPKAQRKYQRDALERLIRLYEAWEKPEKLAPWKEKLTAFDRTAATQDESDQR